MSSKKVKKKNDSTDKEWNGICQWEGLLRVRRYEQDEQVVSLLSTSLKDNNSGGRCGGGGQRRNCLMKSWFSWMLFNFDITLVSFESYQNPDAQDTLSGNHVRFGLLESRGKRTCIWNSPGNSSVGEAIVFGILFHDKQDKFEMICRN